MPFGLTWDVGFLRTRSGMLMSAQVAVGLVGGIIGIVLANGFESFLYWTSAIVSGVFLFTHVTNLTQSLESKFPALTRLHLGYLVLWSALLTADVIYRFVIWNLISIVSWLLLIAFLIDLFFKWRNSRNTGTPSSGGAEAVSTPVTVEAGDKY